MFCGRCAICHEELIERTEASVTSLTGEVAHIVGERKDAARGQHPLSAAQRNETENLILLCRRHHKIIDDDQVTYTVDKLHEIRSDYLGWISAQLQTPTPWTMRISQLCYINVPRLCELAELQGYKVDLGSYGGNQTLHSLGWELNHVMAKFKHLLGSISLQTIPLDQLRYAHEAYIGLPISFDRVNFRTKNISVKNKASSREISFTGDLSRDPHIYFEKRSLKLVINVDPRWITTSTAFLLFRPSSGQSTFSGLARINNVDYSKGVMLATPWVIGIPPGILEMAAEASERRSQASQPESERDLVALIDPEIEKREPAHLLPPPESCDLCGRLFKHERFIVDGAMKRTEAWAYLCAKCFSQHGKGIGWGSGQLYEQKGELWLLVAGARPIEYIDYPCPGCGQLSVIDEGYRFECASCAWSTD